MGKTKIKTIDDSLKEENQESRIKNKASKIVQKAAKPDAVKDTSSVILNEAEQSEKSPANAGTSDELRDSSPDFHRDQNDKPKKLQKPGKAKPRSKKYQEVVKDLDRTKTYPIDEAVEMAKKLSYSSFTGTLEAHINTAQIGIRGLITLPFSSGKTEYKTEPKAPVIHLGLGKLNQPTEELSANAKTLLQTLGKTRIKKITLSPTMGPSVRVDLTSI